MKDNISALITPFDDKENINVEALQQLLDFLTRSGIKDFWVLGTSGEFNMLSQDERILIVSKIREITKGKIYAGINENSLKNSLILAKNTMILVLIIFFQSHLFIINLQKKG